jgi:hypothetical protein
MLQTIPNGYNPKRAADLVHGDIAWLREGRPCYIKSVAPMDYAIVVMDAESNIYTLTEDQRILVRDRS